MTDTSRASNISMWARGDYSLHTQGAKDVIDNASDLALGAVAAMDVAGGAGPFGIADYGAADGGTSLDLQRKVVAAVRARAPHRPVTVTYTDLPRNDYSALFATVLGQRAGVASYRSEHDGVFVYAAATSFFEPIFPDATVDLGFSATAMHWLSALPCPVSDHIHAVGAHGAELEALRARAMEDWTAILERRAAELKPGGRLVLVNLGIDDRGRHMGNTGGVHMFDTMNVLWRALADEGVITGEEYRRTTIPQFYKTLPEFTAPLAEGSGRAWRAGLRLETAETRFTRCPYAARFQMHRDARRFAEEYVPTTRTWSETVFFHALDESRPEAERRAIVDRYFESFVDLVAAAPEGHGMDYVHVYMVLRKA